VASHSCGETKDIGYHKEHLKMIQIEGVTKTFQSGRGRVYALANVSLRVETGQFAALVGKSGSGKSTLLNCIGGIEPPDKGELFCFTVPIYSLSSHKLSLFQRKNMGFIFQRSNLLSYLTVTDNIGFPLTLNKISGTSRSKRIAELLERIGLLEAAKALPHELSSGEMQRVAVARAIAHKPRLLLADEPTANLDTATGKQIVELMRGVCKDHNCTIIMATHDKEVTEKAEIIIPVRDGKIEKTYNE
jgi:ABC-type lipoprotein export system ATPase subunit